MVGADIDPNILFQVFFGFIVHQMEANFNLDSANPLTRLILLFHFNKYPKLLNFSPPKNSLFLLKSSKL
jgi:hypothetical protein